MFRVDLAVTKNATTGESDFSSSTVGVLARLGTDATNEDRRKFFYAPEVARVNDEAVVQEPYELIGIVSGNRAQPQGKTVQDRAYGVRDFLTDNPAAGLSSTNFPACNPLLTGCTPGTPITNSDLTDVTDKSAFVIRQQDGGTISLTNASGTDLTSSDTALTNLKNSYGWYFDLQGDELRLSGSEPAADRGEGLLDRNGAGWTGVLHHLHASGRDYRHHRRVLGTRGHRYVEVLCGRLLHRSAGLRPERG